MKLAFDLDATVLTQGSPEKNYRDSEAIPEMVQLINDLFNKGHEIYFYTARHFKHYVYTKQMLEKSGFKFHGLVMNKISVDLFIDDRGFRWEPGKEQELRDLIEKIKE